MKRLMLFYPFLFLMLLLISGCGKQIVTQVETVYLKPPASLTEANEAPEMPVVPPGKLEVEDVIRWQDERESRWIKAWQESEADKRGIRDYLEAK